jgi:hypothetical protein
MSATAAASAAIACSRSAAIADSCSAAAASTRLASDLAAGGSAKARHQYKGLRDTGLLIGNTVDKQTQWTLLVVKMCQRAMNINTLQFSG